MSTRPYIALHMLTSINGKITGDFLSSDTGNLLCEEYYRINREYKSDGFICGRITIEGSFTGGRAPDLEGLQPSSYEDYIVASHDYYAISIDPHGRLGWEDCIIHDSDPGYDNAHVVEILTEDIDARYPTYLKNLGISYLFCGKDKIDAKLLLEKLSKNFKIKFLLLEGGGLTDTLFLEAGLIDEMSIVVAPIIESGENAIDLFSKASSPFVEYQLANTKTLKNGGLWLNYKKRT